MRRGSSRGECLEDAYSGGRVIRRRLVVASVQPPARFEKNLGIVANARQATFKGNKPLWKGPIGRPGPTPTAVEASLLGFAHRAIGRGGLVRRGLVRGGDGRLRRIRVPSRRIRIIGRGGRLFVVRFGFVFGAFASIAG